MENKYMTPEQIKIITDYNNLIDKSKVQDFLQNILRVCVENGFTSMLANIINCFDYNGFHDEDGDYADYDIDYDLIAGFKIDDYAFLIKSVQPNEPFDGLCWITYPTYLYFIKKEADLIEELRKLDEKEGYF